MRLRVRSRRYVVFALITICGSLLAVLAGLLIADLYVHRKYETTAMVNVWGFRGPTVGRVEPDTVRVAVVGGSTAFGYGPDWTGSFPYLLDRRLNAQGNRRFSVVNLAYNNEGAFAMRFNLEDYAWLNYRVAILYEGYNDLGDEPNRFVFRHRSSVYRLTGYLPILPTILEEKAQLVLRNRDRGGKTTFTADVARETTARAMQHAAATVRSLEDQLGKLSPDVASRGSTAIEPVESCPPRWHFYCGAIADAVTYARQRGIAVIVGTQPFISERHVEQQQALAGFLRHRFGSDPWVVHVDASNVIHLANRPDLAYDGMHLNESGNAIIADRFVQPVLEIAQRMTAYQ